MLSLCFAGLLVAVPVVQGGAPPVPPPAGAVVGPPVAEDTTFVHTFGRPGERGSFRVKFDAQGAGVVFLQMLDHYTSAAAARHEPKTNDDYLLLLWSGDDHSLRLVQDARTAAHFEQSLHKAPWQHQETDGEVQFTLAGDGYTLVKTFRHRGALRGLALDLELRRSPGAPGKGPLWLELLGPAVLNPTELSLFGNPAVALAVGPAGATAPVKPAAGKRQDLIALQDAELSMAGSTNRFFAGFLFPLDDQSKRAVQRVDVESLPIVDDPDNHLKAWSMPRALYGLQMAEPAEGGASKLSFGLYLGPKSFHVFEESPEHERFLPIMNVDLEPPCCVVVPGGRQMASLLLHVLGWFHGVVGNWGIAIMMLTILVRSCLMPVNYRMQKSMRAYGKKMALLKPKMDKLKAEHADDPKAYQMAMVQFQREHKLMPPIGGCLPIFLTMPIYLGLFAAIRTAYDLRQEALDGFWIRDLSQPDMLFQLPFWPHEFNLLPLVWMTLFVTIQLRMPLPTDPQQRQVQQIMRFMPIVFGVTLYSYASGLMVYMVTSMVWTFVESAVMKKLLGPIDPSVQALAPTPMM